MPASECLKDRLRPPTSSPAGADRVAALIVGYAVAPAYFAGFSSAFFAQSSQQTVISLPPTLTLIPPSLMSQSHTGHFVVFIRCPFSLEFQFKFRRALYEWRGEFPMKGS